MKKNIIKPEQISDFESRAWIAFESVLKPNIDVDFQIFDTMRNEYYDPNTNIYYTSKIENKAIIEFRSDPIIIKNYLFGDGTVYNDFQIYIFEASYIGSGIKWTLRNAFLRHVKSSYNKTTKMNDSVYNFGFFTHDDDIDGLVLTNAKNSFKHVTEQWNNTLMDCYFPSISKIFESEPLTLEYLSYYIDSDKISLSHTFSEASAMSLEVLTDFFSSKNVPFDSVLLSKMFHVIEGNEWDNQKGIFAELDNTFGPLIVNLHTAGLSRISKHLLDKILDPPEWITEDNASMDDKIGIPFLLLNHIGHRKYNDSINLLEKYIKLYKVHPEIEGYFELFELMDKIHQDKKEEFDPGSTLDLIIDLIPINNTLLEAVNFMKKSN